MRISVRGPRSAGSSVRLMASLRAFQQLQGRAVRHRRCSASGPDGAGPALAVEAGARDIPPPQVRPSPCHGQVELTSAPGSWPVRSTRSVRTTTRSLSAQSPWQRLPSFSNRVHQSQVGTRQRNRHGQPWKSSTCAHINAATLGSPVSPALAAGARAIQHLCNPEILALHQTGEVGPAVPVLSNWVGQSVVAVAGDPGPSEQPPKLRPWLGERR